MQEILDRYEKTLQEGLLKVCSGEGVLEGVLLGSPDIDAKWEEYLQGYVGDAVANFNRFPEAALGWAAFLGMGVANAWDKDWTSHSGDPYEAYYGPRGWDDMDDHILGDVLHLTPEWQEKLSNVVDNCALATLGLISHEGIETQTALGFYVLVRSYGVLFRIGAAIELHRLGYKKVALPKL